MHTIYLADDGLWCLRAPDGIPLDGESYVLQIAAQHSADLKNAPVQKRATTRRRTARLH